MLATDSIFRIKTENIVGRNVIDNIAGCKPIQLVLQDVFYPLVIIGYLFFHYRIVEQALYQFCDVKSGLHE